MRYLLALVIVALAASPAAAGPGINIAKDNTLQGTGASTSPLGLAACLVAGQTWIWNGTAFACASAGAGGITNGAAANVITKSDGTNLVASSVSDDATTLTVGAGKVTITEASGNTTIAGTLTADATHRVFDVAGTGLLGATNTVSLNMAGGTCAAGTVGSALGATGTLTCTAIGTQGGTTGTGTAGNLAAWNGSTTALGNFAGSSPTACAAGQVLTRVTSAATGAITLTCTAIGTAGGITGSALTTNVIPKATGATSIGNSTISDDANGLVTISPATGGANREALAVSGGGTGITDVEDFAIGIGDAGQTFDATLAQRNFYGLYSSVAATRSAGANSVFNVAIRAEAAPSTGVASYSFYSNTGNMHQSGPVDLASTLAVTGETDALGGLDVSGTNWHSLLNWTGSTNQDSYVRAGVTAGNVWIGDVNTGGIGIGAASNPTTFFGPLNSTAGANTLGETEDNMTTASNSSGTLTDISFPRTARGVLWTITGGLTADGMGFTSGTPTDGQNFKICVIGGGSLVLPHENAGETTVGRRFNFQINVPQVVRSGGCQDLTYDATSARWHRRDNGIASFNATANVITKYTGNYELQSTSITDNATTVSTTEPLSTASTLSACTGCVQSSSIGASTALNAGSTAGTISIGAANTGGITVGQNTNPIALNGPTTATYSAAAATVDKDSLDASNTSTWNTTAAAHNTYGVHAVCNNSISAGANTLTTSCGYFSNTSSGANINAWALVTDTGDVRLNSTSGGTTAHGAFSVDGTTTLNGTLSALAAATLSGGVTVNTGSLNINSGTFVNAGLVDSDLTHVTDKDGTNRPTIANCGTTAPTVVGTDTSGWFITAAGITTSCAITFHAAYSSNIDCNSWITGAGTTVAGPNLTIATSGLTFAGSAGPLSTGLKVHWECKDH